MPAEIRFSVRGEAVRYFLSLVGDDFSALAVGIILTIGKPKKFGLAACHDS